MAQVNIEEEKKEETKDEETFDIQPNTNKERDFVQEVMDEDQPGSLFHRFKEENWEKLKEEFPSFNKSKLDEKIFKMWKKSPLNPKNQ